MSARARVARAGAETARGARGRGGNESNPFLHFSVPLIPPSVNHYKTRFRNGRTVVSDAAVAFKEEIAFAVRGRYVIGKRFSVEIKVVLGAGERGDVDNFPKLVLDGLAAASVFCDRTGMCVSDAHVRRMLVEVDELERGKQGRTEITVAALS